MVVVEIQPTLQLRSAGRAPSQREGARRIDQGLSRSGAIAELLPSFGASITADITFLTSNKQDRRIILTTHPEARTFGRGDLLYAAFPGSTSDADDRRSAPPVRQWLRTACWR